MYVDRQRDDPRVDTEGRKKEGGQTCQGATEGFIYVVLQEGAEPPRPVHVVDEKSVSPALVWDHHCSRWPGAGGAGMGMYRVYRMYIAELGCPAETSRILGGSWLGRQGCGPCTRRKLVYITNANHQGTELARTVRVVVGDLPW